MEPSRRLTEDNGVLVDASSWSAGNLMVNPNTEEIILGDLFPVSAVSVAFADLALPGTKTLPDHLEDIVTGSHPSLGESGRSLIRDSV